MEIQNNSCFAILEERERLHNNSFPDYQDNNGMGADFIIKCYGNAEQVMQLSKKVLLCINQIYDYKKWPDLDEWQSILPHSFLKNFDPERTSEEIKMYQKWWFKLSYKNKLKEARKKNKWTLSNWLAWLEPAERVWFWWGAHLIDENHFVVSVKVLEDPFLSGALKYLFLASGASDVIEYDEFMNKF